MEGPQLLAIRRVGPAIIAGKTSTNAGERPINDYIIFVGLDVHKDSIISGRKIGGI